MFISSSFLLIIAMHEQDSYIYRTGATPAVYVSNYKKNPKLGRWVEGQRTVYRNKTIKEERKHNMLD